MSATEFARSEGFSRQRLGYWKKRLADGGPAFVSVSLPSATPEDRVEVLVGEVVLRVREGIAVARLAELIEALAERARGC